MHTPLPAVLITMHSYDTFHEANTKEPHDCLRKTGLVPELHDWVNSQKAEEFLSKMRKNSSFLNMMTPGSHVLITGCIIHHHNNKVNKRTLTDLRKILPGDITVASTGKAIMDA